MSNTAPDILPGGRVNPFAFAIRPAGNLPSAPWAQGNGSMHTQIQPTVNVGRVAHTWTPVNFWQPTRNILPRAWAPHLGARASYTNWGFPSTWFTLRLPLAQPDLQTALSRRMRPVIQQFTAKGNASSRIPAVFVPVRPTGPAAYGGGPK